MGKRVPLTVLALGIGVIFVGGVWGQKNSPPGAFSGMITIVDWAKKEMVIRNDGEEKSFEWNNETRVNGPEGEELVFEDLKAGMMVTVSYREGTQNWVANRIDIKRGNPKTLKGIKLPFECGIEVC
jgi:hypothetical protein